MPQNTGRPWRYSIRHSMLVFNLVGMLSNPVAALTIRTCGRAAGPGPHPLWSATASRSS